MPCRLSFIFETQKQGWSEVWYHPSSEPAVATAFTNAQIRGFMTPRGKGVVLRAVRASSLDLPRKSLLVVLNADASMNQSDFAGARDNATTALLAQVYADGGKKRSLLLRGLIDQEIVYDSSGTLIFDAALTATFQLYARAVRAMGLCLRTLNPAGGGNLDRQIVSLAPTNVNNNSTTVTFNGAAIPDGSNVIFHKINRQAFPGLGGIIPAVRVNDTQIIVPVRWTAPGNISAPPGPTVRIATFAINAVTSMVMYDIRSKKVGRPSLLSRGRRVAMKFRSA